MSILKIYSQKDIFPLLSKRKGEIKFGENISFVKSVEDLHDHPSKYVLLGIPEDIGVRANYGNAGTSMAWRTALSSLINIQSNYLLNPQDIILLGEIDCEKQMEQANKMADGEPHFAEELGGLVSQIDQKVSQVVREIVKAKKFPIIIGGGHNNSYGNLMGLSTAMDSKINCINFDAHTDFRTLEHRHSGNGFSYALEEGYLDKYFIFGLHRNYTSQSVFDSMGKYSKKVSFNFFEDVAVHQTLSFSDALEEASEFCTQSEFGIELDMDAIAMMGSSAISPSGFSVTEARKFVGFFSRKKNARYLHICEGAPSLGIFPNQVGKTIAYLVSDAISVASNFEKELL